MESSPNPEVSSPELPPPSPIEEVTHFDNLISSAPDSLVAESPALQGAPVMQAEHFHKLFCTVFNMSSTLSGLRSLAVDEKDGAAVCCSQSLYETCLEIPALHFLVQPQGKWGTRIIGIGAFAIPMALSVRAEIAERVAERESVQPMTGGDPAIMTKDPFDKFR